MKMHGWGVSTMAAVGALATWFVACAGETIPTIDEELRDDIGTVYPDEGAGGQVGAAGGGNAPGGAAGAGGGEPAAGAGGGAPVGGGGGGNADVCDAYNQVLVPSCGLAGCHNEGSNQGGFAVEGGEADIVDYVDRASNFDTCDLVYIDSQDPDQSLLWRRTQEDTIDGCGLLGIMPLGDELAPADVECLQEWLTQFAE